MNILNTGKKYLYTLHVLLKNFLFVSKHKKIPFSKENFLSAQMNISQIPYHCDFHQLGFEKLAFDFGSGNGEFTIQYGQKHPTTLIIGGEYKKRFYQKGVNRANSLNLANVKFCYFDSVKFLHYLVAPSSLDTVFINFPDPWHKKRHQKRRVFALGFWKLVHEKMKKQSHVYFISDNEEIFTFAFHNAFEYFTSQDILVQKTTIPTWYPKSKYFRKWETMGRKFQFFEIAL